MHSILFSIRDWNLSSTLITENNQQDWANDQLDLSLQQFQLPKLSYIPALQRRRLSVTTKLLFDSAWTLLDDQEVLPIIFSSHNGELNRSFSMYLDLLRDNIISPNSFALSVHNASIGQWSLLRQDMSEASAISAAHSIWAYAIIEAYALLQEGHDKVLVITVDDPIDSQYYNNEPSPPFSYALSAVITHGTDWSLSKQPIQGLSQVPHYWDGLNWVKNIKKNQQSWLENTPNFQWRWERHHVQ